MAPGSAHSPAFGRVRPALLYHARYLLSSALESSRALQYSATRACACCRIRHSLTLMCSCVCCTLCACGRMATPSRAAQTPSSPRRSSEARRLHTEMNDILPALSSRRDAVRRRLADQTADNSDAPADRSVRPRVTPTSTSSRRAGQSSLAPAALAPAATSLGAPTPLLAAAHALASAPAPASEAGPPPPPAADMAPGPAVDASARSQVRWTPAADRDMLMLINGAIPPSALNPEQFRFATGHFARACTFVANTINSDADFLRRHALGVTSVTMQAVRGRLNRLMQARRQAGPRARTRPSGGAPIASDLAAQVDQLLDEAIRTQDREQALVDEATTARRAAEERAVASRHTLLHAAMHARGERAERQVLDAFNAADAAARDLQLLPRTDRASSTSGGFIDPSIHGAANDPNGVLQEGAMDLGPPLLLGAPSSHGGAVSASTALGAAFAERGQHAHSPLRRMPAIAEEGASTGGSPALPAASSPGLQAMAAWQEGDSPSPAAPAAARMAPPPADAPPPPLAANVDDGAGVAPPAAPIECFICSEPRALLPAGTQWHCAHATCSVCATRLTSRPCPYCRAPPLSEPTPPPPRAQRQPAPQPRRAPSWGDVLDLVDAGGEPAVGQGSGQWHGRAAAAAAHAGRDAGAVQAAGNVGGAAVSVDPPRRGRPPGSRTRGTPAAASAPPAPSPAPAPDQPLPPRSSRSAGRTAANVASSLDASVSSFFEGAAQARAANADRSAAAARADADAALARLPDQHREAMYSLRTDRIGRLGELQAAFMREMVNLTSAEHGTLELRERAFGHIAAALARIGDDVYPMHL